MKKKFSKSLVILIFLFSNFYFLLSTSYAATPTPAGKTSPTDSVEIEKIQKIKDIVASKVAELDLVEKRGLIGTIKDNKKMHLVITDIKGKTRNIDVDELTNFSIGNKDEKLGVSDLEKDTLYSFVGLYNKDTERLLVRTVTKASTIPDFFEGIITSINEGTFQIEIVNSKGEKKTADVQKTTKTNLSTVDGKIVKSGFSKLESGQRVIVAGFLDLKDSNLIASTRVIHFDEIPPSKEMQQFMKISPTPQVPR